LFASFVRALAAYLTRLCCVGSCTGCFCCALLLLLLLLQMFGPDMPPLEWDTGHEYSRQRVQLYYLSNAGQPLQQVRIYVTAVLRV
jgi:hypothetical protein